MIAEMLIFPYQKATKQTRQILCILQHPGRPHFTAKTNSKSVWSYLTMVLDEKAAHTPTMCDDPGDQTSNTINVWTDNAALLYDYTSDVRL